MRLKLACIAVLAWSCAQEGDFLATEAIGDAELRIVLTRERQGPRLQVLDRSEPFEIAPGALQAELDGGGLAVWVFAYRQSDLVMRFPGLDGLSPPDLRAALNPVLEPPAAGRYSPPPPVRALQAVLTEDGPRDVKYREVEWTEVQANPETAFTLALDGRYACPPIGRPFRAFVRDMPEHVCTFSLDVSCQWVADGDCTVDGLGGDAAVRQVPGGGLYVDEAACEDVAARRAGAVRGETEAWACGGRTIAIQRQVDVAPGVPWRLDASVPLTNAELAAPGQWAAGVAGVWRVLDVGVDDLRLRRVRVDDMSPSYQLTGIPLPDESRGRTIIAPDGRTVLLSSGVFAPSVGTGAQCLRLPATDRSDRFFPILTTTATSLLLAPPGFNGPLASTDRWAVAGVPGQIDSMAPPGEDDLRLPPGMGRLSRLSVTADLGTLLVHGTLVTARVPRVTQLLGVQNLLGCPRLIPHPADLAGAIVAAGSEHLALMPDGVLRLAADGAPLERMVTDASFDDTYRLERRADAAGDDVALVYRPSETTLWVFGAEATPVQVELEGPILATLDGPQVVVQTGSNVLLVRDAFDETAAVEYHVPAFAGAPPEPLRIQPEAIIRFNGATLVGVSQGTYAGVLDLRSGLSQGLPVADGVRVETVFLDEGGQQLWLVARVPTDLVTLQLIRIGSPPVF